MTPEERLLTEHKEKWRQEYEREQDGMAKKQTDLARYQEERDDVLIVRSQRVIAELLDTVFTVRDYVVVGIVVVAFATALVALLVFYLSLRLRRGERLSTIIEIPQAIQLLG